MKIEKAHEKEVLFGKFYPGDAFTYSLSLWMKTSSVKVSSGVLPREINCVNLKDGSLLWLCDETPVGTTDAHIIQNGD